MRPAAFAKVAGAESEDVGNRTYCAADEPSAKRTNSVPEARLSQKTNRGNVASNSACGGWSKDDPAALRSFAPLHMLSQCCDREFISVAVAGFLRRELMRSVAGTNHQIKHWCKQQSKNVTPNMPEENSRARRLAHFGLRRRSHAAAARHRE